MDYGGDKMQSLGFIIDKNGRVTYFGEWVEKSKIDEHNRRQRHTQSFEDEVEPTDYFKSLNLVYKKEDDHWFVNEALNLNFSLQGIIVGINNSYEYETQELIMTASSDMTDLQKESLSELYETLKKFDTINIKTVSKLGMNIKGFHYDSVDNYFEDYGVDIPKLGK